MKMTSIHAKQPLRAAISRVLAATAGLTLACIALQAQASSHREAPFIAMQPAVDGTDLYMFRSYEPGRSGYVTLIADYIPFQDPQGGPNFYPFDPTARYAINIDNTGSGKANLAFVFRFKTTSKQQALVVGGKKVKIPLIQSGTIPDAINPATLNVRETYSVAMVRLDGDENNESDSGDDDAHLLRNVATGSTEFDKPVDNIGDKTFKGPNGYDDYAEKHIYDVQIPGCGNGRVFVGQRKEPFYIAVGKIFDLFNLNPLGREIDGNKNDLETKNISSLILEVPIACVTHAGEPVIGAYTTASVPRDRTLTAQPKTGVSPAQESGQWTQVSRLGMPLVNEVVIGRDDKDKFNGSRPIDDTKQFADYVTNPTLPTLIQILFPSAKAPTNFPRTDLVTVFLTGIAGLNQPKHVVPAEMLRLNTAIAPRPRDQQNALGVAAGDNAGFPNGRRPGDDVVDLSVRVAMGALCVLTGPTDKLKVGCKPSDAPAGALPFTDGVRRDARTFEAVFPYLNTPIPGSFNN